uniref:ANK_REP_REGION domain-containing protein n=1 Tax=Macrostomum lignano TaxID=282301 RepID=A0A1I8HXP2_9PLAT
AEQSEAEQAERGRARQSEAERGGRARQSEAERGRARQSEAERGRARQSEAEAERGRGGRVRQSEARSRARQSEQSRARQSEAERREVRQSEAERGRARQSEAERGRARQSEAERGRVIQSAMAACKLILESCSRSVLEQMDISSRTAVHLATLGGHGEVLNYLLDQGAEIDARDGEGATAWDYAKQRRLHYCKLILASHYRQKLCSSSAGPDVGDAPAGRQSVQSQDGLDRPRSQSVSAATTQRCFRPRLFSEVSALPTPTPAPRRRSSGACSSLMSSEFAVPRPPRTPPTPRSKSPSSSGRRRLIPAGGAAAVSRESSLENGELPIQLAPVAEAAQTSSARAEPEPEPEVTAEIEADASAVVAARPVEGRRASEPTAAVVRRERTTRNSAEHPDPQRLHPRPPLGSPDRRLIRGAQPPYKLPHRPSQSGAAAAEKETDDEAEESESTLPPPPPEFQTSVEEQVASGDDEGDKEPPLDTERMQRVAVQPKPQERHRHNPPPVSVESQTAPAQLMPLPIAYTEAASAAAPSAGSRRRLTGKKKKRRPADAGVSGGALSARDYSIRAAAAGFVQPLVENVINSVTLQQRVPPMASPRSASASAISGGQTLMVSSAVLPAKRGLQGRPDQLVAPDASIGSALVLRFADYCQQQRHRVPRSSTWNGGKGRHDPPDELVQFVSLKLVRQQQQLDGCVTRRLQVSSLTNAAAGVDGLEFNSRTTSGRISQQSGEQARVLSHGEHLHATDVHVQVALSPRSSQAVHQLTAVRLSSGRSQLLASQQEVQAAGAAEACAALCQTVPAERLPAPAIDEAQEAASSRDKKKCAEPITDSNSRLAAAQASRSETAVRRRKIFASSSGGSLGKPLSGMLVNPIC